MKFFGTRTIALMGVLAVAGALSSAYGQTLVGSRTHQRIAPPRIHPSGWNMPSGIVPGYISVKMTNEAANYCELARPQASGLNRELLATRGAHTLADLNFVSREFHSPWTRWQVPEGTNIYQLAKELKGQPGVVMAEPVLRLQLCLADPNDGDWNYQESDPNLILYFGDSTPPTFRRLWHMDDTDALAGWSIYPNQYYTSATKPANPPTIAIIDTGVDETHPDFINAGGTSADVSQGGQIHGSLNAYFNGGVLAGSNAQDVYGHGTHVAGLALAAANNGNSIGSNGTVGLGYNCQGMVIRVFDNTGSGTDADGAAAIRYAADNGADVINLSLGDPGIYSQDFQDAVTYAWQKGTLVVCAANDHPATPGDNTPIYPAACSGALAVTATGPGYQSETDPTYGYMGTGTYIDVAAPGGGVVVNADSDLVQFDWSTTPTYNVPLNNDSSAYPPFTENYSYLAGSSMASPLVAGAAGQYIGEKGFHQHDGYSNLKTYRAIEKSALGVLTPSDGDWETTEGYGCMLLDALLSDQNTRGATVGAVKGIVYYNETPLANVSLKAVAVVGTNTYTTNTLSDGTYRFAGMQPGLYKITANTFGVLKTQLAQVDAGSDLPGFDFRNGTYTSDTTAPVVAFFNGLNPTTTGFDLHQWGYDPESSISSISIRIGTTSGGNNVMPDTVIAPDDNIYHVAVALNSGTEYFIQATYTNGGGLTTVVNTTINTPITITGTITLSQYSGPAVPVTVEIRTAGVTSSDLQTLTVTPASNGSYSFATTVGPGTYDVAFKGFHWLKKAVKGVTFGAGTTINVALINGDANNDNAVTSADYGIVKRALYTVPGDTRYNPLADLNGDGKVNLSDFNIVRTHLGLVGDP